MSSGFSGRPAKPREEAAAVFSSVFLSSATMSPLKMAILLVCRVTRRATLFTGCKLAELKGACSEPTRLILRTLLQLVGMLFML